MSKLKHDIDDDEIRIISSRAASGASSGNRSMRPAVVLLRQRRGGVDGR